MVQTKVFLNGEHNYTMITGPTGPLVCVYLLSACSLVYSYASFRQVSCRTCPHPSVSLFNYERRKKHQNSATHVRRALPTQPRALLRNLSVCGQHAQLGYLTATSQQTTTLHLCLASFQRLLVGGSDAGSNLGIPAYILRDGCHSLQVSRSGLGL